MKKIPEFCVDDVVGCQEVHKQSTEVAMKSGHWVRAIFELGRFLTGRTDVRMHMTTTRVTVDAFAFFFLKNYGSSYYKGVKKKRYLLRKELLSAIRLQRDSKIKTNVTLSSLQRDICALQSYILLRTENMVGLRLAKKHSRQFTGWLIIRIHS